MEDSIIVKCPECGQWVEIERSGFLDKASRKFDETYNRSQSFGDKVGNFLELTDSGKRKIGKLAYLVSSATNIPTIKAGIEAIAGDSYVGECPNCGYEISEDDIDADQSDEYEEYLEENDPTNQYLKMMNELNFDDEDAVLNCIDEFVDYVNDEDTDSSSRAIVLLLLSRLYNEIDNSKEALRVVRMALKDHPDSSDGWQHLCHALEGYYEMGAYLEEYGDNIDSYFHYECLSKISNHNLIDFNYQPTLRINLQDVVDWLSEDYVKYFLNIPTNKRRFISFSEKFDILPENVLVIPLNNIPENIEIDGDIEENALYILHPYKPNKYILADDYSMYIFRDKAFEFKNLMIELGAKNFAFEDTYSTGEDYASHNERTYSGSISGAGRSAEGKYAKSENESRQQKLFNEITQKISYQQTEKKPQLPDNLVWYPHEEQWKKEVQHRLDGRTITAEYTITLNKSELISTNKKREIEADVKLLKAGLHGDIDMVDDYSLNIESCHAWKCLVEFYPMDSYNKPLSSAVKSTPTNSADGKVDWSNSGATVDNMSDKSKIDLLRELKSLLDAGILTEEEFLSEKRKVLSQKI